MSDTLKTDVRKEVESILSEKERAELEEYVKSSLDEANNTIASLTSTIEEKEEEVENVKEEHKEVLAAKDDQITLYKVRVDQLENELKETSESKKDLEETLESLKAIAEMNSRIKTLDEKGVILKDEAFDKQKVKVASLSDEDFEEYVNEMVSLKAVFSASAEHAEDPAAPAPETASADIDLTDEEVDKFAKVLGCDKSDADCLAIVQETAKKLKAYEQSKAQASETEDNPETEGTPPPPKLDPKAQVMASINLEAQPSEDLIDTYMKLGKALASKRK